MFTEAVEQYLQTITYDGGWVRKIRLPQFGEVDVEVDPDVNWGQHTVAPIGVRVQDILSGIRAGGDYRDAAQDFDLSKIDIKQLTALAA